MTKTLEPERIESSAFNSRLRLHYLDGLRGLAALIVAFTHTFYQSGWQDTQLGWEHCAYILTQWISQGRASVAIFIVLSGYCLMLPVARNMDGKLKGGTQEYLKRRMRRILPPYYAALILILVLIYFVPFLRQPLNIEWSNALPALTSIALLSHLFLVHNLNNDWALKINPPMWSVATEWQIYFIFPALLLPIWRRFGSLPTILTAFIAGFGCALLLHSTKSAPWFIGLFALGMIAATYSLSPQTKKTAWVSHVPWGSVALSLFICFGFIVALPMSSLFHFITKGPNNWLLHFLWAIDILVGMATASLLIFSTRFLIYNPETKPPLVLRLLEAPWLVVLGGFSYSFYLIHDPIIAIFFACIHRFVQGGATLFAVMIIIGLPIAILLSYIFHLAFEKRFMSGGTKRT